MPLLCTTPSVRGASTCGDDVIQRMLRGQVFVCSPPLQGGTLDPACVSVQDKECLTEKSPARVPSSTSSRWIVAGRRKMAKLQVTRQRYKHSAAHFCVHKFPGDEAAYAEGAAGLCEPWLCPTQATLASAAHPGPAGVCTPLSTHQRQGILPQRCQSLTFRLPPDKIFRETSPLFASPHFSSFL